MKIKDELKETSIKNCPRFYFDDLIRAWDRNIYSIDILLNKKLYKEKYKNILIYDISYKTSSGAKPLRNTFDKIDRFIKIHDKNIFK